MVIPIKIKFSGKASSICHCQKKLLQLSEHASISSTWLNSARNTASHASTGEIFVWFENII